MDFDPPQLADNAAAVDALIFMREITRAIGAGFHPDTPAADYIRGGTNEALFTHKQAARLDSDIGRAFRLLEAAGRDPYDIAIKVQRRLLGFPSPAHEMRPMTKISVYRPRLPVGLGPPEAFLGEDHPTSGDWIQSAKAELPDERDLSAHYRLHLMGRAFLIYSMYHAREPRFLGYAVENFGAAVTKLGYRLPLTEKDAVWLVYSPSELDPASPEHYAHLLHHIATVFGPNAATEQASAIGVRWQPLRAD